MTQIRTQRLRRQRRGGFTLVEAMIATTILTLSVVALSETLIATYSAESAIRREEQAMLMAQELAVQVTAKPMSSDDMPAELPSSGAVAMRNSGTGSSLDAADADVVSEDLFRAPMAFNEMPTVDSVDGSVDVVRAAVDDSHPAAGEYTRTIRVTRHRTPEGPEDASGSLRRVTVTVTDPSGRDHVVSRMVLPVTMD
ncbi:MAG: prepilin-type N-terminal cleavage/methylation domain-containing protein [Planctomycetota bacterium]